MVIRPLHLALSARRSIVVECLVFSSMWCSCTALSAADAPRIVTKETIAQALEARQRKLQRVMFSWTEQRTEKKGWKANGLPGAPDQIRPATDLAYSQDNSLSFDAERVRFEYRRSNWRFDDDYEGPRATIGVFDGKVDKSFYPPPDLLGFPRGNTSSRWSFSYDAYIQPFLWACRPLETSLLKDLRKWQLSARRGSFDGRECVVLEYVERAVLLREIWLDPMLDYALVRRMDYNEEKRLTFQCDVRYRSAMQERVFLPSSWKIVVLRSGSPIVRVNGELKEYTIDPEFAATQFTLDYPVGTRVIDETGEGYVEYIVRPDGSRRNVLPEEWVDAEPGHPEQWTEIYEHIRDTEPPDERSSLWGWPVAVVVGAILILAIFVGWRKLNRVRTAL